jgi:hypothetical protein
MPHAVAGVVLAALSAAGTGASNTTPPVELRLFANKALPAAELLRARAVVDTLLKPARIAPLWVDCDAEVERCQSGADGTVVIEILIQPVTKGTRSGVCGEAAQSMDHRDAVIVFAPCATAAVADLRRRSTDPRLLTLRVGDLVGLTIAHELGHVWGLSHRPHGLMMPRFTLEGILDLRSGRTGLAPEEVAHLARRLPEQHRLLAER